MLVAEPDPPELPWVGWVWSGVSLIAARGSGSLFKKKYQPAKRRPATTTSPIPIHMKTRRIDTGYDERVADGLSSAQAANSV